MQCNFYNVKFVLCVIFITCNFIICYFDGLYFSLCVIFFMCDFHDLLVLLCVFFIIRIYVVGTRTLSGILSEREAVASEMLAILDEATDPWGIKVERVEVKDVRLPVSMQRAMAAEAEAARDAKAKVRMNVERLTG